MIRKVLVTGDKGYIGSVLVPKLLKLGLEVVGLDTDYYAKSVAPGFDEIPAYTWVKKDIRHVEKKDLEGVDGIIHLSALSNDPMGDMDEKLTEEVNYRSTVRLAELARDIHAQSFIFSSSCSVYGKGTDELVEESNPTNPLTVYARFKVRSEDELAQLSNGSFFVGLMRNSTVYGYSPKFRDDLVVNNLVVSALLTGELRIMSDGTPWRPLIDVRDLSNFFTHFLLEPKIELNGKVVNVGFTENNFRVHDVVNAIHEVLPDCKVRYTGEHGADTRSYRVSFEKLRMSYPDVRQEWTLKKSVLDLVRNLTLIDIKALADKRYTRIHVLKTLMEKKAVNKDLFWA